ncbi:hypothetical protein, partial [Bordetella pertussis]
MRVAAFSRRQRGQALAEALPLLAVLLLAWAAVAWLGTLRHQALRLGQHSRVAAFMAAAAAPSAPRTAILARQAGVAGRTAADGMPALLARDWLQVDTRLLRAQAAEPAAMPGGLLREGAITAVLRGVTVLAIGPGHASDARGGNDRLARSVAGWQLAHRAAARASGRGCLGPARRRAGLAADLGRYGIGRWRRVAEATLTPAHLAASASTWLHLPPGVVAAALAGQIQMFGVPAEVRVFHAPQGIDALLAHFATRHAELRDLTVLPGLAVLAGGAGDCTHTISLAPQFGGVEGVAARLCWPRGLPSRQPLADVLLPPHARLRLDVATRDGPVSVAQQVWHWRAAGPTVTARWAVRREARLRASGWRLQGAAGPACRCG